MVISIIVMALVVILDQLTKFLVVNSLALHESFDVIPGVFRFTYIHNDGAAFGMLDDHRWVFMLISSIAILAILVYIYKFVSKDKKLLKVALSLVVGGGIGNMIDRISLGYVVDFLDFYAFDFWKWIFNVADAAVCIGAALIFIDVVIDIIKEAKAKKASVEEPCEKEEAEAETSNEKIEETAEETNEEATEEIKEEKNEENE